MCHNDNTIQEGMKLEITLIESKIDKPLINNGKILNKTMPDPNKINDGIKRIIFAIILSPIRF